MAKRRPKHGYCASCGNALKRPAAFESSCSIKCAAQAWHALQGSGCGLDNESCTQCGEYNEGGGCGGCCEECNLLKEKCDCEVYCHVCSDNYDDVYHGHPVGRDCTRPRPLSPESLGWKSWEE